MNLDAFIKDLTAKGARVVRINAKDIEIRREFADMCKSNACGKYNTNWSCPPATGTFEQAKQRILQYDNALVIQKIYNLDDCFDFEGMIKAQKDFAKLMLFAAKTASNKYKLKDFLPLGIGGCTLCEQCTYPNHPCRYMKEPIASLEGYGIDALSVTKLAKLPYKSNETSANYIGLILY